MPRPPQVVHELAGFVTRAAKLLSEQERDELIFLVASRPTAGDLIQGTGGVRKLRFRDTR